MVLLVVRPSRNRHNDELRVIKFMMPDSDGELSDGFKLAVVETELQQKLSFSEFIATIYSWGTFDGAILATAFPAAITSFVAVPCSQVNLSGC